jgi:hypothetical protein
MALLVVENATVGHSCLEHIRLRGYERVYHSVKGDSRPGQIVNTKWGSSNEDRDLVAGFTTSSKNRSLMLSKLEEYIRNRQIFIRSKRIHEELKTFIWDNGRAEAARGSNDDLTMSMAIAVWIKETFMVSTHANVDTQKHMLAGIGMNRTLNNQINGASKDPRSIQLPSQGIYSSGGKNTQTQSSTVRLPHGRTIDYSWLYK